MDFSWITHCCVSAPPECVYPGYLMTSGRELWSGGWRTIITSMLHHGVANPLSLPRTYLKVVTAAVASVSVVGGGCHDKKNAVCVVEPGWANRGAEETVLIGGRRINSGIRLECAKLKMD